MENICSVKLFNGIFGVVMSRVIYGLNCCEGFEGFEGFEGLK
jgi:hypothetical protein